VRSFSGPVSSHSYLDVHSGRNGVTPIPRNAFTIAHHELRGRPVTRASVSITAVSAESSPPFSKWIPFCVEGIQRVLSPPSWPKCNGKCSLPTEDDTKCAHVVSDDSRSLIRLTMGYRYLCLLAKTMNQLLMMIAMELSLRYLALLTAKKDYD
jgi:hypothetical protein